MTRCGVSLSFIIINWLNKSYIYYIYINKNKIKAHMFKRRPSFDMRNEIDKDISWD